MATHKKSEIWLVGHSIECITGAKLPSRGDVLRHFFFYHKDQKKTIPDSAAEVAKEVLDFWLGARILVMAESSIRRKIVSLFEEWKVLQKIKRNTGIKPREKQKAFEESLPDLLDIAHADALALMTIKEDKDFLMAQREKGRRDSTAGHDKKLEAGVHRRERTAARGGCVQLPMAEETVELESSLSASSSPVCPSMTSSSDEGASPPKQARMQGTKTVMFSDLVSTLDRTGGQQPNLT
ncbi:uncharacterized protein LOC143038083 [Oratosquilla oratoria]|uniref:uncharacterized protein LOC143038083 n=1 Tax=Oratosquilla oratoria TaxID=337810 RepID=UPI003F76CA1F